jgi:amino acid adenylation domain-containing protein
MLEAVVAHPSLRLSQLPLLTDAERRQMLGEWNDTRARVPEKCVHQFFEEQVERASNAVAVVFGDQQLTYRELNERAHRLADELRALGVGPGVPVGLCVQRSLEMLAGLLGILKAGGCYVPLDPTYPEPRLAFMLKDSQASALVIQERLQHRFKFQLPGVKLLCLDAPRFTSPTVAHPAVPTHAAGPPRPDNLAYVLYTSGSTGQPKGVMVTHRNVANFFAGMDRVLGSEPGVWLAVTSISFDISVLELFWTLARGFKVVIQPDDYAILAGRNGDETFGQGRSVPEQIVRHGITHMQCTPSLAGALVLAPASLEAMRRLNMLLLGGEALPVSLAKSLREILSGRLLNMYGPTETTVWSTTHRVTEATGPISIGRPIVNTEIYVLDRHLQPVPVGVTGELFIGGAGVARGYLGRPELTREKFIPHPFRSERTACLYRTGDLARYRSDGTLDFLGRGDHQVKIRGHRIEMGEIEAALLRHPSVREAVVVARTDSPGGPRLFAYLSATTEPAPGTRELRQALQSQLPDYMVPSAFVWLTSLPLTPNGKIDRRALPEPNEASVRPKKSSAPPRTKIERAIAEVWQEMLGLEQVGRHDNFFDLGGHSLLVVQTQARLREALGVELPVVRLFQSATISALAAFLEQPQEARSLKKVHDRGRKQREAFGRGHQEELPA